MGWLRISFTCRAGNVDDVGELLEKFDAISISYSAATEEEIFADGRRTDSQAVDRYWERTIISALFHPDIDIDILTACVRSRLGKENVFASRCEAVRDENWLECNSRDVSPMIFSGRLCICPSWCTKPAGIPYIVELDPGLAFGSGSHPTTALCLQWLAETDVSGCRVIDYGCGSGILGIAAARLGATRVFATDIDPQALHATAANAARNRLAGRVVTGVPAERGGFKADILLANILLGPLLELSDTFGDLLPAGGRLVLSGLLAGQLERCRALYSRWFDLHDPVCRDEWIMLCGVRNNIQTVAG